MDVNQVSGAVVDAAMKVHSALGPGLLESAYRASLAQHLRTRGFRVVTEKPVAISYEGVTLDVGYRLDLLVDDAVVVEVKAVSTLHPIHEAQLLSHLKLANYRVGLLVNFHEMHVRDGIVRLVNKL